MKESTINFETIAQMILDCEEIARNSKKYNKEFQQDCMNLAEALKRVKPYL